MRAGVSSFIHWLLWEISLATYEEKIVETSQKRKKQTSTNVMHLIG